MGRGGREGMAGMAGGLFWGAVWGSLVGGLVLLLAALLLDLGAPDAEDGRAGGIADDHAPAADVAPPRPEDGADSAAAAPADGGTDPGATPPGDAPVVRARVPAFAPPADRGSDAVVPGSARRSLLPRPAKPALPDLRAAGGASGGASRRAVDLPPVPVAPMAGPVGAVAVAAPIPLALPKSPGAALPRVARPDAAPRSSAAPRSPVELAQGRVPDQPQPPGPLIAAAPPPAIAAAPPAAARPAAARPVATSPADPSPAARAAPPPRPAPSTAGAVPLPPGPRVAFVLLGNADRPRPDWLRASASGVGDGDGPLILDGGGPVFVGPDAAAAYRAARATGTPGLLAYARLDGAVDADALTLARIALRARRDGAVAVLVAPDPALWDRIDAWLDGPARDLVPVGAAGLLE